MMPDELRALERAEARLKATEERAARMIAQARADVARAMLAAGPSAVARRDGVSRQTIHAYIRRNLEVSPDPTPKLPSRRK